MGSDTTPRWRQLDVGVIGGGIGGMSVGIALRRAGHLVTVYEKHDFVGEVGASVSCAANGSRWLRAWDVDVARGDPVVLRKLINRDWTTGAPVSVYDLDDYEQRWGCAYYMFHRQDMHAMLKECAMAETGRGEPVRLMVNHQCERIDLETTTIHFANGVAPRRHDLVVGADGIGSVVRGQLGIHPAKRPAESSCLHANVKASEAERLGLADFASDHALQYWGGQEGKWDKIVLSPCHGGRLLSYYCFFPRALGDYSAQQWGRPTATGAGAESRPVEELLAPFPGLDPKVKAHLAIGEEIQPWRLWIHDPYPYIQKGNACLLGDAGHPMMPHQSQGACMAIEDAAALGILLDKNHFNGDVAEALAVYDEVRLPRATRVQSAAAKAAYNINERIGFSANKSCATYKVDDEKEKLTIEEMNAYEMEKDIEERLARRRGTSFAEAFCRGLPIGMQLPNGVVVGAE